MADRKSFITPLVRITYPTLWTPRAKKDAKPGDKPRFSVAGLLLPKDKMTEKDRALYDALMKGILELAVEKMTRDKVAALMADKKLKTGIRDDVRSKGYPEEFAQWLQPWTTTKPGIVSNIRGPDGKPIPITEPTAVYGGCWGRLSVTPSFYDNEGNKGISLMLNNVQKVRDDARLDGRRSAEDEFEADEDATPEALAALQGTPGGAGAPASGGGGSKADLEALLGGG